MLSFFSRNKHIQKIQPRTEKGDIDMSGAVIAKEVHIHHYDGDRLEHDDYESIAGPNLSRDLKEIIIPIESLLNEGKFSLAIQKFKGLVESPGFSKYSKDERFLVYNGLLNCYINSNFPDAIISQLIQSIEALGENVQEVHRYYFLLGMREYNKRNFEKSLIYLNQSTEKKADYLNAITMRNLVRLAMNEINYDEAKSVLTELLNRNGLKVKDYSTIHSSFGHVAFNSQDYATAKEHYLKSDQYSSNIIMKIGVAICQYFMSFEELKSDGKIDLEKIDFESIAKAEKQFRDIYENRNDDTLKTIVDFAMPYYLNILALMSKHKELLDVYDETKDYFQDSMTETLEYIVEAQVVNQIYDEVLMSKIGEFEQIRYEALYYERKGDYGKVIEILTPVLDGRYKNEKALQLAFLIALQGINNFEKYMYYYQKFSAHDDEVMRMNYVQFLEKKGEKELVLSEINSLKAFAKNSFVLYDLMQIYLDYELYNELDEFFKNVDSGVYNIIGFHRPRVFYEKMLNLLNLKNYQEYFKLYDETNLTFLSEKYQLILKINYFLFKHDLDKLASAFYEYFKISNNHNDLIKAVQARLQINQIYDAEFYLDQVNAMLLELPENYYILKAIILKEKNQVEEAFKQLQIVISDLNPALDSPFHQFYVKFCTENNRTDDAIRYMGEYYAKNPHPDWFTLIKFSESDTGADILKKLEDATGGKRDLSKINRLFSSGSIGVSVYNNVVGISVEEILCNKQYPFTRVPVSRGNVQETQMKVESIDNKIIIDAITLIILAYVDGLSLLDVFDELIITNTTAIKLTESKSDIFNQNAQKAIAYVSKTPRIKRFAVDEAMRIRGRENEILGEDIMDCIALSTYLKVPFLSTEVAVTSEFQTNEIIDVNVLVSFLKRNHPEQRKSISRVILDMKKKGFDFVSFNADDMFICYEQYGIEEIKPFLEMGINANYWTFTSVYANFLRLMYFNKSREEFHTCSNEVITFMDRYFGKTRYYSSSLLRQFPILESSLLDIVKRPSVKKIMLMFTNLKEKQSASIYAEVIKTSDLIKLRNISVAFIFFLFQYFSLFGEDPKERERYIGYLTDLCTINSSEDIEYALHFLNDIKNKSKL